LFILTIKFKNHVYTRTTLKDDRVPSGRIWFENATWVGRNR